ncbi:MAG: hypothetical protein ACKPKO_41075, partial [Candidatus Fonsibacter sp.]
MEKGEASGEHLIVWCPVVALAWQMISRNGWTVVKSIRTPSECDESLSRLLQQASFFSCSLRSGVTGNVRKR